MAQQTRHDEVPEHLRSNEPFAGAIPIPPGGRGQIMQQFAAQGRQGPPPPGMNQQIPHHGPPPPQQHLMPPPGPPAVPQLPPQMFTTAAQLLDLTDKKLMVVLRDGRKLIGVLRSWDQFGNLVLQATIERLFVQKLYADIDTGLFLVRGENVSMLGEIDLDKDDYIPEPFELAPVEKVFALQKQEEADRKAKDKRKLKRLAKEGFEGEHSGEAIF